MIFDDIWWYDIQPWDSAITFRILLVCRVIWDSSVLRSAWFLTPTLRTTQRHWIQRSITGQTKVLDCEAFSALYIAGFLMIRTHREDHENSKSTGRGGDGHRSDWAADWVDQLMQSSCLLLSWWIFWGSMLHQLGHCPTVRWSVMVNVIYGTYDIYEYPPLIVNIPIDILCLIPCYLVWGYQPLKT